MSKMKRIVVLLMIVMTMLAQAASAAASAAPNLTIPQIREEAASGWHETIEGPKGPVVVDIDITVPEVAAAPVVDVLYIMRERPELMEMWPDRLKDRSSIPYHYIESEGQEDPTLSPDPDNRGVGRDTYTLYADQVDWNAPIAEENTITLNQAVSIAQESLKKYRIDDLEFEWEQPRELLRTRYRKGEVGTGVFDGEPVTEMGYIDFRVKQKFAGIPHIADVAQTFSNVTVKRHEVYSGDFKLSCSVASESSFFVYGSVGVEVARPYDDIPLCSLDDVKAAIVPLIEKGYIRDVHGLELAYVSYRTGKDVTLPLRNIPTWVLSCIYYPDTRTETTEYDTTKEHVNYSARFRYLLVNAQTGELIDPESQSDDRTMAPAIIPW